MLQTEVHIVIVIYEHKTFTEQATEVKTIKHFSSNLIDKLECFHFQTYPSLFNTWGQ
jgi:hypothetical protein